MKKIITNFVFRYKSLMADINRIKVVLVEQKDTNKWFAGQLSINPSTVSKCCINTLIKMSKLFGVDMYELLNQKYIDSIYYDTNID